MAQAEHKAPINVMISGAAGQIGYSLVPLFCSGQVFGMDQPMNLILLDIEPMMKALDGIIMELDDGAYPLVYSIVGTHDHKVAFKDLDYAILVGGLPRKQGQSRGDLLVSNIKIFESQGKSLGQYSKPTCKVLVVANPANSNCWVCAHYATQTNKNFKKTNFTALTRLDMNRAVSQLSMKLKSKVKDIDNVIIWGNHSELQVPDISGATVNRKKLELTKELTEWLPVFETTVQQRGKAVIQARGASSALSAANGIRDCVHDWHCGSNGRAVSMAIYTGEANKKERNSKSSDKAESEALGKLLNMDKDDKKNEIIDKKCKTFASPLVNNNELYNLIADLAPDTYFSCPVVCQNGEYKPVPIGGDIAQPGFVHKIAMTGAELVQEKVAGLEALKNK